MKKLLLFFFPFSLIISSCAYHIGYVGGGSGVITNNDFANISFAYGSAKTMHVLGIGGNKKDALVLEAKRDLYKNADLQAGQVIGQTTVDFKTTWILVVAVTRVTISAEIIDFSSSSQDADMIKENFDYFIKGQTSKPSSVTQNAAFVAPDELHTPKDPKGKLIKFKYKGNEYTGELMGEEDGQYLIRMENQDGERIGFYIDQADVIE